MNLFCCYTPTKIVSFSRHPNRLWPDDLWTGFKKVLVRKVHQISFLRNVDRKFNFFAAGCQGIA